MPRSHCSSHSGRSRSDSGEERLPLRSRTLPVESNRRVSWAESASLIDDDDDDVESRSDSSQLTRRRQSESERERVRKEGRKERRFEVRFKTNKCGEGENQLSRGQSTFLPGEKKNKIKKKGEIFARPPPNVNRHRIALTPWDNNRVKNGAVRA